jgi:hypothetical protein
MGAVEPAASALQTSNRSAAVGSACLHLGVQRLRHLAARAASAWTVYANPTLRAAAAHGTQGAHSLVSSSAEAANPAWPTAQARLVAQMDVEEAVGIAGRASVV